MNRLLNYFLNCYFFISGLNLSTNYFLGDVDNSEKKGGSFEEVFKSELVRGIEEQTVVDAVTKTSYDTSSHAVKAKTEVDSANKVVMLRS